MPKIHLTQQFTDNPPIEKNKPKMDYFDTLIPGFLLEVRNTGKGTYYQRYRDKHNRIRQARIGPADAITLEEARQKAKQIRSATLMGYDPNAQVDKNRDMPTLKEFINTRYLPHIKTYKRSWNLDKTIIEQKILPRWGNARVSEITRQDIQEF